MIGKASAFLNENADNTVNKKQENKSRAKSDLHFDKPAINIDYGI
ncbi:MAG TPA: hypothetical protein VER14_01905 [Phototrophicaceae bacterium]|nr:hypothetical protein [Phototrophicaceae bacterium]